MAGTRHVGYPLDAEMKYRSRLIISNGLVARYSVCCSNRIATKSEAVETAKRSRYLDFLAIDIIVH